MRSRREVQSPRNSALDELRAKHRPRYDAVDGDHWGCICDLGIFCEILSVLEALTKSEQEVVRLLKDLKKAQEELSRITSELMGSETRCRILERKNNELRQGIDHSVS